MKNASSLFKTFSTDGSADTSFASGPPGADASDSWVDGISSDTHAGNAANSTSLDAQTSNIQDPFLVSFEDGAPVIVDKSAFNSASHDAQTSDIQDSFSVPFEDGATVIVDEPGFHFPNLSVVTPMTADSTSYQHDGLTTVVADLGWSAGTGTGSNAFDASIHDAAALNLTQSNSGSGSSGSGAASSVSGSALVTHTAASGLTINVIYDSSVTSAPAGFKAEVNAAVQYLESLYNDPITITIDVGYGEVAGSTLGSGALGESETYLNSYSYSQLATAMKADATSASDASAIASLLGTNPTGNGTFWVSTAESKALGLAPSGTSVDGYVGFASSTNTFDYNSADGVTAGQYDFFGVFLHEVTEVMGRQTMDGQSFAGTTAYEPLDLFHYSAPGVHDFSGTKAGYFSVNGGTTNLANFNTNPGGDFGDWASTSIDAMNAFGTPGVVAPMTSADIKVMDVLGWNLASGSPPPVSQPDLVTSGLSLFDTTASYNLSNAGAASSTASTTGLYLSTDSNITTSDMLLGTFSSPSLSVGGSHSESIPLSLPTNLTAGTYYLGVIADYNSQVNESNETNNASNAIPIIVGNSNANTLNGTAGNDTIFGLAGNDTINGGAGNDVLIGGTGNDTLTGGAGNDQFVFNATNEGLKQITDFSQGDLLDFSRAGFGNGLAVGGANTGILDPSHFVANATGPTNALQELWFNTSNHTLYFDSNGSAPGGQVAIEHLQNNFMLHSTDIHII
jgi:Ca2+-binding RTX toxin-like protein